MHGQNQQPPREALSACNSHGQTTANCENSDLTTHAESGYVVTIHDSLSTLPPSFNTLFASAGKTSIFHTLPWYVNYIQTVLNAGQRLRIYAIETANSVARARAVLVMYYSEVSCKWFHVSRLTGLANFYTSLFGPVMDIDCPDARKIFDILAIAIARDSMRWDVIDLHPLAVDEPYFDQFVQSLRKAGLIPQTYFCFGNHYLQVNQRSFADYFQSLPSKLKNTISRKQKQFEKTAGNRIVVYRDTSGLDKGLDDYERIYRASWKIEEPHPQFIRGMCRTFAHLGWLRLGIAYLDEQPIAAQIWIVYGGIANIYKLAYDENFAKLSAGSILTKFLMQAVIDDEKVKEVDYLTGDDAYKKDWMSNRRERWGIIAFNRRTPYGLIAAARHSGGRLARRIINAAR